jgi:hypothetical protein
VYECNLHCEKPEDKGEVSLTEVTYIHVCWGVGDVADRWSVCENEDWRPEHGCTVGWGEQANVSRKMELKY